MKRLLFILALTLTQEKAFAASAPIRTPVHVVAKTPTDKLQLRIRQQVAQIQRDVKAGKLTQAQGKALKAQVGAIRQQEITDLKQNGTKTLTDAQVADLNQQLNILSKSIPIR